MPNTIQLGEYSMGSVMDGVLYITDSDGNLKLFNVNHDDNGRWLNSNYGNPENVWNGDNQFVFCYSLHSPPQCGGVSFYSCLINPPKIFPTSFNLFERIIYFLLSKALISQEICKKNLSKSNLEDDF